MIATGLHRKELIPDGRTARQPTLLLGRKERNFPPSREVVKTAGMAGPLIGAERAWRRASGSSWLFSQAKANDYVAVVSRH